MIIGYARVSTDDQSLDSQTDALSVAGAEKVFADKISGSRRARPELDRMLEQLRDGDVVTVTKYDRLARSLKDLLQIVEAICERGAPNHPQTQGKIERWHQTMKNRVLLENYFLPGDLERQIGAFIDHYNNHRYHESLNNLTPADVYNGRGAKILKMREEIKKKTIKKRRLQHQSAAA